MAEETKQPKDADIDSDIGEVAGKADEAAVAPDNAAAEASESQTNKATLGDGDSLDPIEMLMAERDSLKDQLLRALADVENMRRRTDREMESARKYGHTGFARDLVGAIDNLARAIEAAPKSDEVPTADSLDGLITGIEMSWTEIQTTMERHGIRRISPKGEKFDYNFHQAMFEMPHAELAPGTVVEVVQHGYVLHDRLLRPAMVGVAKAADSQPDSKESPENS